MTALTRTLTIAAPRALADAAVERATADGVSVATIVRRALKAWGERNGLALPGPIHRSGPRATTCRSSMGSYLPLCVSEAWATALDAAAAGRDSKLPALVRLAVAEHLDCVGVLRPARRALGSVRGAAERLARAHAARHGAVSGTPLRGPLVYDAAARKAARVEGERLGWALFWVSMPGGGRRSVWAPSQAAAEAYADAVLRRGRRAA